MADVAHVDHMMQDAEGADSVFFVSVKYKGTSYPVPAQAEDAIASIFDFVHDALDFPRENCKLIHVGKTLRPDHDAITIGEAGLTDGSKLMLVASSAQDVSFVRSSRADPLVKGFAEEERDEISRRKRARAAGASAWGTKQDQEYRFNSIKAQFKYSQPPPYEAEKLLQKLATDPGIIEIMKTRKFKVGILTEMSPDEAQERMAKKGTPNMDLLGYNQNAGEMIVLRIRTDNVKGFRPYHDLVNTLIHELTHNVWGPHDDKFWKLYGELKAQYMRFHRFWSHGGKSAQGDTGSRFEGFAHAGDEEMGSEAGGGFGRVLGTVGEFVGPESPRSRRMRAAEARAALGEGPQDHTKPNFLAGNGEWVFLCPCGQQHDPAGCGVGQTQGQVSSSASGSGAAASWTCSECASENSAEDSTCVSCLCARHRQVTPQLPQPQDPEQLPQPTQLPELLTPAEVHVVGAIEITEGTEAIEPMPLPPRETSQPKQPDVPLAPTPVSMSSQMAPAQPPSSSSPSVCVSSQAAASQPQEVAQLDLALEAQGLDGAMLWLHRFSQRLQVLRGLSASSMRAVELLLKLVSNVVEKPSEPKFRRVRAENPKLQVALASAGAEADALLGMLGFEASMEEGSKVFVLRDAVLDTARLRLGKELLEEELRLQAMVPAAA